MTVLESFWGLKGKNPHQACSIVSPELDTNALRSLRSPASCFQERIPHQLTVSPDRWTECLRGRKRGRTMRRKLRTSWSHPRSRLQAIVNQSRAESSFQGCVCQSRRILSMRTLTYRLQWVKLIRRAVEEAGVSVLQFKEQEMLHSRSGLDVNKPNPRVLLVIGLTRRGRTAIAA